MEGALEWKLGIAESVEVGDDDSFAGGDETSFERMGRGRGREGGDRRTSSSAVEASLLALQLNGGREPCLLGAGRTISGLVELEVVLISAS